jgi:type IV pilus assembly protein PilA
MALPPRRKRLGGEDGFTLVELLVVILIIGILAAIAIPSFLNQRGKATDASAKELAHTAEVAMETYSLDNGGSYAGATPTILHAYEVTLPTSGAPGSAWLSNVVVPGTGQIGNSYTVTTTSTNLDTFSITRSAAGLLSRACTTAGTVASGCPATNIW